MIIYFEGFINQIQINAGNGTEHGEQWEKKKKLELAMSECHE